MATKPYSIETVSGRRYFASFEAAERYAKRKTAEGYSWLCIAHQGHPIATVKLDYRDIPVVDLNNDGAALIPRYSPNPGPGTSQP